jgi:hypothetical protein
VNRDAKKCKPARHESGGSRRVQPRVSRDDRDATFLTAKAAAESEPALLLNSFGCPDACPRVAEAPIRRAVQIGIDEELGITVQPVLRLHPHVPFTIAVAISANETRKRQGMRRPRIGPRVLQFLDRALARLQIDRQLCHPTEVTVRSYSCFCDPMVGPTEEDP